MKESRRISGAEPRRFVRSRPRTASAQTLIFLSPKAPRGPLSAEDGNPEAPISGQHQGHFLHCITRHHRAPTMSKGAFPKPALHRRSSQRCKMATAAQPLTLLAERAPELMHYHPPAEPTLGHLQCSPARPAEGGRGPRPRRRARTASLQLLFGRFLCSRGLRTDWDKMAEWRGRSRQPAHLTRKYRP